MRRLAIITVVLLMTEYSLVMGCDCGPPAPACAYVNGASAVFVGKVAFTDDDGSGTLRQRTLVRFEVEEAFKGLLPGTRDVWIDPGSFTSCYASYEVGERYLVFAYGGGVMPRDTAAMSLAPAQPSSKPLPPGFDPANPPIVYFAPGCSGTRPIIPETEKMIAPELDYLRQFRSGTAVPTVRGRVTHSQPLLGISQPLGGVSVTLSGSSHERSLQTDKEGNFRFNVVPDGAYSVKSTLPFYISIPPVRSVTVAGQGCGYAEFKMMGSGVIEGQVLDQQGRPLPEVRVEVVRLREDGRRARYGWGTESDTDGIYRFERLPSGEFEVGVNLYDAPRPRPRLPYPTTRWSENGQSIIQLNPGERRQLTPFKLPAPLKERTVEAEVRWPDGRFAEDAMVSVESRGENAGYEMTDQKGRARLILLEGLPYTLNAIGWVDVEGKRERRRVESAVIEMEPGSGTVQLKFTLDHRTEEPRR